MSKVTRIAFSKNLNQGKFDQLVELATRLGVLRFDIWRRFGSLAGLYFEDDREVRDSWLEAKKKFNVSARLWKATLADVWGDIVSYREAAKTQVRKIIYKRTKNKVEIKRLFTLLKTNAWNEDSYLRRLMRKHFKHGITTVNNQIILDTDCYTTFFHNNKLWLKVTGLNKGKRIAIPLNTSVPPTKTLRLILRDNKVEIHYPVDEKDGCSVKPCGDQTVGIDKGYTEAFTDSDGQRHGINLGVMLSIESDRLKVRHQRRNKLRALAEKHNESNNPKKRNNILTNNLGRKKLDSQKRRHTSNVRDLVFKAAHSIVARASTIAVEDLTSPIKNKKPRSKNQSRRLSSWVKGILAQAINVVSHRRGSTVVLVNAAYTSQMDSRNGCLLGTRSGDKFYCFDGAVLDADQNAAQNILARMYDPEIKRFTPFKEVKEILVRRTGSRLGLLNQDSSYNGRPLLTESEMPNF